MDTQIKKGILEMCILKCIAKEPLYGYDIIQRMHVHFPEVGESAFYTILRRLHKEESATTFMVRLEEMIADWQHLKAIVAEMEI